MLFGLCVVGKCDGGHQKGEGGERREGRGGEGYETHHEGIEKVTRRQTGRL